MEIFNDYAYYYNKFYQDKNYAREAKQVDYLLKKYGDRIHTIINFGCGTGKHDVELSKMQYKCEGIDLSPLMIEIAKENAEKEGVNVKFSVADIQKFVPEKKYDAVISLFHVMSYQISNENIISSLISARKALNRGALFLFDIWYGPGVLSDRPCIRVKEIEDQEKRMVRIARPLMQSEKNIVSVLYDVFVIDRKTNEVETLNEVHNMRYFFRPELELMLHNAGFELIDNFDCNTLKKTNFDSWTSFFLSRAI